MTRPKFSCQISHKSLNLFVIINVFLEPTTHEIQKLPKYKFVSLDFPRGRALDYFQRVRSILSQCLPVCQLPMYSSTTHVYNLTLDAFCDYFPRFMPCLYFGQKTRNLLFTFYVFLAFSLCILCFCGKVQVVGVAAEVWEEPCLAPATLLQLFNPTETFPYWVLSYGTNPSATLPHCVLS